MGSGGEKKDEYEFAYQRYMEPWKGGVDLKASLDFRPNRFDCRTITHSKDNLGNPLSRDKPADEGCHSVQAPGAEPERRSWERKSYQSLRNSRSRERVPSTEQNLQRRMEHQPDEEHQTRELVQKYTGSADFHPKYYSQNYFNMSNTQ
mmetsp:Transcript_22823/g.35136  ORF Transcript_22823/g.35136 Transcript_22823/m.35136 type:complete len:148 (-) Transcript_22823:163-606(-)|eukprot:CAMPEP_0170507494 /NCGR_PEP_ID=MMETSP0208-20121228/59024_1 /TAXON_ID=197538 /ORGANISM="Strombidium inclinatum, Strain S3" /LENGTH=147 /DNA_ID=CAMNT_0010789715 /DNA_START=113 /DNA_END=556 /DNA_ORIENTATION=-